jgi:pentapeptide MXKDX repeat protein
MNNFSKILMCACIALSAGAAFAQDAMKKDQPMAKDGMIKKDMTMQECKDHMAVAKKDGMKKDDAMMKKDTMCADIMKKDDMKKEEPMKK